MYDIFFNLNDMHQVVEDAPASKISELYDELAEVERIRFTREQVKEAFEKGFDPYAHVGYIARPAICAAAVDDETSFDLEIDGEVINFNFELDFNDASIEEAPEFATVKYTNGAICDSCNELYPYAEESNQRDGTFKCYSCRKYG